MSEEKLLSILCDWLREERKSLDKKLVSLNKDIKTKPEALDTQNSIKKIESELTLITEDVIKKYQLFWASLSPHSSRPCPFCFIHSKESKLHPLPEKNGEESVKCEACKKQFYFPSGLI